MGRFLVALVAVAACLEPAGFEVRAASSGPEPRVAPAARLGALSGRFSLVRGVIGGSVAGQVDRAFSGTALALCFLPGTFDATVDGSSAGELQPSSHCGTDASVRIEGFGDLEAGDEGALPATMVWTDLAGRTYTLRFDTELTAGATDVRVICLGGGTPFCQSAVVDTARFALLSQDGVVHDTGSRARLFVSLPSSPSELHDLGVYDVPFTLTIERAD